MVSREYKSQNARVRNLYMIYLYMVHFKKKERNYFFSLRIHFTMLRDDFSLLSVLYYEV